MARSRLKTLGNRASSNKRYDYAGFAATSRAITREIIPPSCFFGLGCAVTKLKTLRAARARQAFARAPHEPVWLDSASLQTLQSTYPAPPGQSYAPEALERKGEYRAGEIMRFLGRSHDAAERFLELGCWDGMVSCALQGLGRTAMAVDLRSEGFDRRAARRGVTFVEADAGSLPFPDESFDCAFSYASFEHFKQPQSVLEEAIRVTKPGGWIYLSFAGLYMSPWGLHAGGSINVPYCQLLFPRQVLEDFVNKHGLAPIEFDSLNGWTAERFRQLWKRHCSRLKIVLYHEGVIVSHLDLVTRYPSCFSSKTGCFDNLIVSSMKVLFRRAA